MRYAAKRDENEAEIVADLRKLGAYIFLMDQPVDVYWAYQGRNGVFEIKTPNGRLTNVQADFIHGNHVKGVEIPVVTNFEEAAQIVFPDKLDEVNRMRREGM